MAVHRVKVYKLSEGGEWLDKGTGHISVEYMEVRVWLAGGVASANNPRQQHAVLPARPRRAAPRPPAAPPP